MNSTRSVSATDTSLSYSKCKTNLFYLNNQNFSFAWNALFSASPHARVVRPGCKARSSVKILLFLMAMLLSGWMVSQNSAPSANMAGKTAVFKIKKHKEQNPLTSQLAIDIDKELSSKKGILSSNCNTTQRTVTVKMVNELPEEEIERILIKRFGLEVESHSTINNTK